MSVSFASHLASTTFCWLPPERFWTSCDIEGVRMRSWLMYVVASSRSARRSTNPNLLSRPDHDQRVGFAFFGCQADACGDRVRRAVEPLADAVDHDGPGRDRTAQQ